MTVTQEHPNPMEDRYRTFDNIIPSTDASSSKGSARSLSVRLAEAQDVERRKISRELHDSVGQSLVAAKLALANLKKRLGIAESELKEFHEVEIAVEEALAEVRTVSHLLHPPTLDLMGLRMSIVSYAAGFQERTGIQSSVEMPDSLPQVDTDTEAALFRVVQESLTNVHRHARASTVAIRVAVAPNEFQLSIYDNGVGLAQGHREGIGIQGMRERLAELNGTLTIEAGYNGGSTIVAKIPLSPSNGSDGADVLATPTAGHRILVVDDHDVLRRGVRSLLAAESDFEVCGEASSAEQALEAVQRLRPDVIVLDVQMPGNHGWSVVREMKKQSLTSRIIVLSHYDLPQIEHAAKVAGCYGYVSKSRASNDLVSAIRAALAGSTFFNESQLAVSR